MAEGWTNTTHDWQASVDRAHLLLIGREPDSFAPGGVRHLLHEVLAYVADEVKAIDGGSPRCDVALLVDGSLCVRDYGRGTDTRHDEDGRVVRKPVMATKDLRFFNVPEGPTLPDGHPRKGMSVVSALSEWLLHENRRLDGGWGQRYQRGVPLDNLVELAPDGSTGTLVHLLPKKGLLPLSERDLASLHTAWPLLDITCRSSD